MRRARATLPFNCHRTAALHIAIFLFQRCRCCATPSFIKFTLFVSVSFSEHSTTRKKKFCPIFVHQPRVLHAPALSNVDKLSGDHRTDWSPLQQSRRLLRNPRQPPCRSAASHSVSDETRPRRRTPTTFVDRHGNLENGDLALLLCIVRGLRTLFGFVHCCSDKIDKEMSSSGLFCLFFQSTQGRNCFAEEIRLRLKEFKQKVHIVFMQQNYY